MSITKNNYAKAEMLIRKPVEEVFNAFVNPEITTKFWFTKSTGRLVAGKSIEWIWEMYDYTAQVKVISIEQNKSILIEWGNYKDVTKVEWTFTPINDGHTFVSIINREFKGTDDEIAAQIRDSSEGFAAVLAGLKALFEHNIKLNLVVDRFPGGLTRDLDD